MFLVTVSVKIAAALPLPRLQSLWILVLLVPVSECPPPSGPDHAIDNLGEVVVGRTASTTNSAGDLSTEDEKGFHVSLPFDIDDSSFLYSISSFIHDQSHFL